MEKLSLSKNGLFHLFVVYIVWSSTYLAIRVAVGEGSGFPPFAMGASRLAIAGIVLLAFAYIRKNKLIITAKELLIISISGISVSYTHLRAHETRHDLVCRLLL